MKIWRKKYLHGNLITKSCGKKYEKLLLFRMKIKTLYFILILATLMLNFWPGGNQCGNLIFSLGQWPLSLSFHLATWTPKLGCCRKSGHPTGVPPKARKVFIVEIKICLLYTAHREIISQLGYNSGHIAIPFSPLFYPHHSSNVAKNE